MRSIAFIFLFTLPLLAAAQTTPYYGSFSGNFESNNGFYIKDKALNTTLQEKGYATNNYLKLNYSRGPFSASIQYEAYLPPLAGYSDRLEGHRLMQGYLRYYGNRSEIILGNFYEQIGSGIIMRSYEERALGINSSLLGAIWRYRPADFLSFKIFAGRPRTWLRYSSTVLAGVDGDLILSDLLSKEGGYFLKIGGGYLHQRNREILYLDYPLKVDAWSGRMNFSAGRFNLSTEYNFRSAAQTFNVDEGYSIKRGNSFLINAGYDRDGLGISTSFRGLSNMATRTDNTITGEPAFVNYLPALTKQHKYTLAGLFPYQAQYDSEIGGQADLFWELPAPLIGTEYPEKISLNISSYYDLKETLSSAFPFTGLGKRKLFNEVIVEVEKRWTPGFKSEVMIMNQNIARTIAEGYGTGMINSQIIAADLLFSISRKSSVRTEIQHSWSNSNEGNWVYGLAEYGLAPHWLFNIADMYNYNSPTPTHYYNFGASYSGGSFRSSVAFGRNRAGNQCVGGICHYVPSFSGVTLSTTITF